ncbi:acyltransferase [Sessilibacter corallicola]|uniref:acyltransferase n=1 Tax=Sessilibacter corallicola TaxID=2904075 RepID=UPI001E306F4E|nr:acyltransferase [Sessilibacter corallicola]MCE2028150.1 acyltransferase [Sessilibacter corallicola]
MLRKFVRSYAFKTGKCRSWYIKLCRPDGLEYAEFLKKWGDYYAIGEHCSIPSYANVSDTPYIKMGNNVRLSNCSVFGHDGSVNMLNRAFGRKFDKVAKVEFKDNVFVGHGAIILPGVTIGPNAIVAAGAVVSRDVPEDSIVAGSPAKVVSTVSKYVEKMDKHMETLPWADLIANRKGDFDPELEPTLMKLRVKHFFENEHE